MQVLSYMRDNLHLARALTSLCKHQHRAMQLKQPGQHCFCISHYHAVLLFAATGRSNLWMSEARWPKNTASTLFVVQPKPLRYMFLSVHVCHRYQEDRQMWMQKRKEQLMQRHSPAQVTRSTRCLPLLVSAVLPKV